VIISDPEISIKKIDFTWDFILLGCDGLYDKLSNEEIIQFIWKIIHKDKNKLKDIHNLLGYCI